MRLIAELRRRNVIRMAGLYLVAGWLVTQVAGTLLPMFDAPPWIARTVVTLLAIGFVPALVFAWIFELTPAGLKRDADVASENPIAPRTARRMDRAVIVILACALTYFAVDKFVIAPRAARADFAAVQPGASPTTKSIAVLPFANTSEDAANEYFSDGLAEELISSLSRLGNLKVIGRTSSFHFKGSTDDSRSIGAALGVGFLLEGSVRKSADRVRIAVALLSVADGANVWSDSYDRELKDIFAVQTEIATAVARKLEATLLGDPAGGAGASDDRRPPNGSVAAYTALMQANFYANKQSEADYRKAIGYYDEAVRLDPNYGLAYAGLSRAWSDLIAIWIGGAQNDADWEKARAAAKTALALAPQSSLAHQALADIKLQADFDLPGAEEEYRRSIALAPADGTPKIAYAVFLLARGQREEALALIRAALALDPLRTEGYVFSGRGLVAMGRYDEAEAVTRKGVELQPDAARLHSVLTEIAILRGQPALALAEAGRESEGFWRDFAMALAMQKQGDAAKADAALHSFIDAWARIGGSQVAIIYALREEPDRVFEWLDRAFETRDTGALTMPLTDPFLLKYEADPRFTTYAVKAGLLPPK